MRAVAAIMASSPRVSDNCFRRFFRPACILVLVQRYISFDCPLATHQATA
jgi:hypothetical protein